MSSQGSFDGRHVVVTGGTGALGSAVVNGLVHMGATCHIPCYAERELERFGLADHAQVHVTLGVDLTSESQAVAFYDALPACWASIHITGGFTMAALAETSAEDMEHMFKLNVMTCFLSCREAIKVMRTRPGHGGRIVNIAARPALAPVGGMTAYTVSKSAVVALTRAIGAEVASEKIYVNAIAPSVMNTYANRTSMPDADHASWPTVDEVARTINFLASPDNSLTYGAIVPVYGTA